MSEQKYSLEEIKELRDALGFKNDPSSTTPGNQSLYGYNPGNTSQYGVFSGAAVRPGMFSATAQPQGISGLIARRMSEFYNELYETETGVTAGSGSNTTSVCAAAPQPGVLKVARQSFTFGMIHMDTKVIDITTAGMRINRAAVDREIYNTALQNNPLLPQIEGIDGTGGAATELRAALYTLGTELARNIAPVHFLGTAGTANNTYLGVATQWAGLDTHIATGKTDSVSGQLAPALDSTVETFNALITSTDANSRTVVEALTDLMFSLQERARAVSQTLPQYVLVMRPDLFRALTDRFAEQILGYRITAASNKPSNSDQMILQQMRNDMFNGRYLQIDGVNYPVATDDAITRLVQANNQYESDIYVVATNWGGRQLLNWEFFPMNNASAEEIAAFMGAAGAQTMVINDGMYRVFRMVQGGCFQYKFVARPRLILDAPFLSGRLDNVRYTSYYRQTEPTPGASYYVNGGVSYR